MTKCVHNLLFGFFFSAWFFIFWMKPCMFDTSCVRNERDPMCVCVYSDCRCSTRDSCFHAIFFKLWCSALSLFERMLRIYAKGLFSPSLRSASLSSYYYFPSCCFFFCVIICETKYSWFRWQFSNLIQFGHLISLSSFKKKHNQIESNWKFVF